MFEIMTTDRTIRIRGATWSKIEKLTMEIMKKEDKFIKPTDMADMVINKGIKDFTIEDYKEALKNR